MNILNGHFLHGTKKKKKRGRDLSEKGQGLICRTDCGAQFINGKESRSTHTPPSFLFLFPVLFFSFFLFVCFVFFFSLSIFAFSSPNKHTHICTHTHIFTQTYTLLHICVFVQRITMLNQDLGVLKLIKRQKRQFYFGGKTLDCNRDLFILFLKKKVGGGC